MGPRDLQAYNFYDNERIEFTYESGIKVEGLNVTGQRNVNGKLMLIQFIDCTVSYKDEILFSPADGMLNLAVGKEITSAYAGPADYYSFDQVYHESDVKTIKSIFTKEQIAIQKLYEKVRHFREEDKINKPLLEKLKVRVENEYPNQWLLIEEIEELIS